MPVQELKWGDRNVDLEIGGGFSAEEQRMIEERMKQLDLLFKDPQRHATYKLEVMFNRKRSMLQSFPGVVTWWHSGNKLHGGGDSKIYLCPGKERKNNDCTAFLYDKEQGMNFVVCEKCGSLWRGDDLFGEVYYNLPMGKWADVLLSWFLRLQLDADIRIKYARDDIRSVAMLEQERNRGGELLLKARDEGRRTTAIYPLDRIIQDTSAGATLHGRILAFLKS